MSPRSRPAARSSSASALTEPSVLAEAMRRADVIAVGPGLGRSRLGDAPRWTAVLDSGKPLVVDADALNLLAEGRRAGARGLDPDAASRGGRAPARRERAATSSTTGWPRSSGCSSASTARSCSRAPAPWSARAAARPGFASAAIPAWRPPAPGMCSPARSPAFSRSATIPGRRRASGCWCMRWPGDAAARAGERGVLASDLTRELHHCVNL